MNPTKNNVQVEIKNLAFSYGNNRILKNINATIPRNLVTAIMGHSGCGKTTLIRLIAGLERPNNGQIIINGNVVSSPANIVEPSQRNIGYIFQDLALWPHLTVQQHISYVLSSLNKKPSFNKIKEIATFFKLEQHLNKYPDQLSGGQKHLLALARAMAVNPSLLLMDEPLTGMDPLLKKFVLDFILKIKNNLKTTIIYVTHDRFEVEKIADYIIMMKEGEIISTGNLTKIKSLEDKYIKSFFA
jgi:iron(III) transport system ATP-binding protein